MREFNVKRASGLLVKTFLIVLILVQVCIFVSVHKAKRNKSVASGRQGPDVVWVNQAGATRFVLSPINALYTPVTGIVPSNFTLLGTKFSRLETLVQAFHQGSVALILTTINAP